jgi:sulfur-oxidizing protein SoxA
MRVRFIPCIAALVLATAFAAAPCAHAADTPDPVADARAFRDYFTKTFPKVALEDFVNGPYSMSEDMHRQWEDKEQFPPYEFALEAGKEMFSRPFKNGKTYADCFANGGIGVRQTYPMFDPAAGRVVTLELALNRCREANGEAPYSYVKDEMAALTAYMAFTSRGKPFDIKIPDDPRALDAYQEGKRYFYTRRGQLNFSCATCHVQSPGQRIRAEVLAPALGILTRCRSIARNGAAWAPPAGASPPATARSAAFRWSRSRTNTAISNITCPMSATACRSPARERGHERAQHERAQDGAGCRVAAAARGVVCPRGWIGGRLQGRLCRGGRRRKAGGQPAQSMDHHGIDTGGGEKGRCRRRFRAGDGAVERGRSPGESLHLPGDQ